MKMFAGKTEVSWNERESLLYDALQGNDTFEYKWVREVFDDFMIVGMDDGVSYRAEYTLSAEGEVEIADRDEWVEVKQEWIAKSMRERARKDPTRGAYIKSIDPGKTATIMGYGAIWGGKDLSGEFFTKATDFWFDRISETPMVLYQHGQDGKLHMKAVGHVVSKKVDDVGLWIEAQIDLSDAYAAAIPEIMDQRSMGWSSGCVGYLAEVASDGEIKSWPTVEFSLTPTPMEPRTLGAEALRTLAVSSPAIKALLDSADAAPDPKAYPYEEDTTMSMSQEQFVEMMAAQREEWAKGLEAQTAALAETHKVLAEDRKAFAEALAQFSQAPPTDTGGFATDGGAGHRQKSFGNFLVDVRHGKSKILTEVYGSKAVSFADVDAMYAAANYEGYEGATKDLSGLTGAAGGYTIPTEFLPTVTQYRDRVNPFRAYAWIQPMLSRRLLIPALDQTGTPSATNKTQQYGGVHMTWTEELGTKDETEPAFKQLELNARKLAGYTQASDELMDDNGVMLEALLSRCFGGAIGFSEVWSFCRGTGAGMPLGFTIALDSANLGPTLTVARAGAGAIAWADIIGMEAKFYPQDESKCFWLANATCKAQIMNIVDTNGNLIWVPNAREGLPQMLLGRPLHFVYNQSLPPLGTEGDLCLVDGSQYIVGDKGSIAIGASEHYAFVNDKITWRVVHRVAGMPVPPAAFVLDTAGNKVSPFVILTDTS